jgi:hypothetical protein
MYRHDKQPTGVEVVSYLREGKKVVVHESCIAMYTSHAHQVFIDAIGL